MSFWDGTRWVDEITFRLTLTPDETLALAVAIAILIVALRVRDWTPDTIRAFFGAILRHRP